MSIQNEQNTEQLQIKIGKLQVNANNPKRNTIVIISIVLIFLLAVLVLWKVL